MLEKTPGAEEFVEGLKKSIPVRRLGSADTTAQVHPGAFTAAHDNAPLAETAAERATREPMQVVARAVDNEAPYFVDMVGEQLAEAFPGVTASTGRVDVYTTLDMTLQRHAEEQDAPGQRHHPVAADPHRCRQQPPVDHQEQDRVDEHHQPADAGRDDQQQRQPPRARHR